VCNPTLQQHAAIAEEIQITVGLDHLLWQYHNGVKDTWRDIPNVEVHMLDTGHFALETNGLEIAALIREFPCREVPGKVALKEAQP
jgi:hypothetical protein